MLDCPVCKTKRDEKDYIETYTASFNKQEYKLYHCPNCDLQWWEPLKIVPEFYEQEGDESYVIMHMGIRESLGENHKMFFKHCPIKSGRLLDVGCGDGLFLAHAQRAGFEVWGLDFDSKSIKVCQEKRGLKNTFVASPWEFADYCERNNLKFDVITFFEVLEHQDDPVGFLEAIKRMLKPEGWIAGSVPNRESWLEKKVYREIYHVVDNPPHHFIRFSKVALNEILSSKLQCNGIFINPTIMKLSDLSGLVHFILFGEKIIKKTKRAIANSEYASEGTTMYKELPLWRKFIFKSLKTLRNIVFLVPAFIVKHTTEGMNLYFQGRVRH